MAFFRAIDGRSPAQPGASVGRALILYILRPACVEFIKPIKRVNQQKTRRYEYGQQGL